MQKSPRGELPPGHEGGGRALPPWAHPPTSWAHGGPPPLIPAPIFFSASHKHEKPTQSRVSTPIVVIFDLLAQSTSRKTTLGNCSSVCDSSNGPISFCSSALFIANSCCYGDLVLEHACQIYMVQSSFGAGYSL